MVASDEREPELFDIAITRSVDPQEEEKPGRQRRDNRMCSLDKLLPT